MDNNTNRIFRVGPDGILTTVAGGGTPADNLGDGGPATAAKLAFTRGTYGSLKGGGVAVGPDGSLYIADTIHNRIRRVGLNGIITTVAGNGTYGFSGDGGPATAAALADPSGVAVALDGSLYIADRSNGRIRRVGTDGMITTVAGGGIYNGSVRDGGLATAAWLYFPSGVALGRDGSLYIADTNNNRIRRVGTDGMISTVAGNGPGGFSGDGGPATATTLAYPYGVAVALDGSLYIADTNNNRIRRVGTDGIITTMAGGGIYNGNSVGDGGPATAAVLYSPVAIAVAPDGGLFISENSGGTGGAIRQVKSALAGFKMTDFVLPSNDRSEYYHFDASGRHLNTLNALTGAVIRGFTYDGAGRLLQVTDGDGNGTTIVRDPSGHPTAIIAPGGQRTAFILNANGYLATVTNPANTRVQLSYSLDGLLATQTDPNGGLYRYSYDNLGRLIRDEDPAGGVKTLARSESPTGYSTTLTTALGRTITYQVERLSTGAVRQINSDSHGARTEVVSNPDGTQNVTYPDGTAIAVTLGPDPRFGMQAPRLVKRVRTLPGGQTETTTSLRFVSL
ncbi:MAG: hypothetical protein HY233_03865, partial [Acidobacteriales bacterium]|nr:hypothetical protein [Terriglobales bacterium]